MEFLIIGLATALNFIIIKMKLGRKRYEDAALDFTVMVVLVFMFSGSYAGVVVAMVSSTTFSLYLLFSPPNTIGKLLTKLKQKAEEVKNSKTRGPY